MSHKLYFAKMILELFLKLMKSRKDLMYLNCFDSVTGAKQRSTFFDEAQDIVLDNDKNKYCIAIFDIKKFRIFNENYGREMGDKLLEFIANKLNNLLLPNLENFGRMGSDEFAVMFCAKDKTALNRRMTQVFKELKKSLEINKKIKIGLSFGIYYAVSSKESVEMSYEKAKSAQKSAKSSKSLEYMLFDKRLAILEKEEAYMEQSMEKALVNNEFKLFLQPQYKLKTKEVCGLEALCRWEKTKGDYLPPMKFIPLFEQNKFILKLDFYMFEKVCRFIKFLIVNNIEPVCISVNFSRLHVYENDWVKKLCEICHKYNVPKSLIKVEVTESFALCGNDKMVSRAGELKKAGFKLSIDDFGAGYSSLGILKSIPAHEVKLDRSFFFEKEESGKSDIILRYIIAMSKDLGLETVAEGIEKWEQIKKLEDLNCDMVQGFIFSKPMPAKLLISQVFKG